MPKLTLTTQARSDLLSIGRYNDRQWGREQRNAYLHEIDEKFGLLSETPSLGQSYDHVREGYRAYRVGRHLIFYRRHGSDVEIDRILHERMDLPRRLE